MELLARLLLGTGALQFDGCTARVLGALVLSSDTPDESTQHSLIFLFRM